MKNTICVLFAAILAALLFVPSSEAQSVVGDLLGGKLVKPKVGQWVWYDLSDPQGKHQFAIRQAIVGEEKVGRKQGYWVEFEIVPEVGYKAFYKVLLTGPASDARNIHRLIYKDGPEKAIELPVDPEAFGEGSDEKAKRESHGMEEVSTPSGAIRAEHIEIAQGDSVVHMWVDESVLPTGVVRMKSSGGDMLLRSHGVGGTFAESKIDEDIEAGEIKVDAGASDSEARTPNAAESE